MSTGVSMRDFRLATGLFLLIAGVFTDGAVISYCLSWKEDMDQLISSHDFSDFIFNGTAVVHNWGGRLGAVWAHVLVYHGFGIMSLVAGLWLMSIGLNLLYGKKILPVRKYLRLFAFCVLIIAPLLTYFNPKSEFPYGGVWGSESIRYLTGLVGGAGSGLLLLGVFIFFLLTELSLDFRPFARKAKRRLAHAVTPTPSEAATEVPTPATARVPTPTPVPELVPEESSSKVILDAEPADDLEEEGDTGLSLTEREEQTTPPQQELADIPETDEQPEEEDDEDSDEEEFSFEVVQKKTEKPAEVPGNQSVANLNEPYDPSLDLSNYQYPTLDLLEERDESFNLDKEELEKNKNQIIQTLRSFGIEIQRITATVGPTVTLYEIVPAEGVRISKIRNLEDDIALNLAALGIRIIAPIPGKGTIGIEVPNAHKQTVSMRALLASEKFVNSKMSLPIALGKKIDNENYIVDLATMPHLLVAGATGQGKSVGINAILVSLLYKKHPSQVKFVMVDPKKVELSIYRTIEKHFLAKLPNEDEAIITDTGNVIYTLNALCIEMDNRYEMLKEAGARNIREYNEKFVARKLNPLRGHKYLPFIVLVIDEFADLIMTAGKQVEMPIARLAQLARAVGIHLIIATQRPSVNVITGTIKANFPGRIAFKVSAKVDSRTILDTGGAEQLIGRGDMLVSHGSEVMRLQCAFVDTPEVENVVEFIGRQQGYPTAFELPEYDGDEEGGKEKTVDLVNRDALFEDCARAVVQTQSGSTSMLQRRFNLGYNRAGRIMDQLEAAGIVGPAKGSKPREVLYHSETDLEMFLNDLQ